MCMLKFLLIFCFIGVVAYLIKFFLVPCLEIIKNGEESKVYKKVLDELKDYCKDENIDEDVIIQQINLIVKTLAFILIAIITIMSILLWLAI